MKEKLDILMKIMIIFAISLSVFGTASAYQVNMSSNSNNGQTENAAFIVKTLKYEPYPVNAGDWFDIWVQVQNIGQNDALNSKFEITADYPFSSSENLTQSFNVISGTINANKNMKSGEQNPQENTVVLKYRIRAADNAKEGENILKFKTSINGANEHAYELPIYIEKTKTDFLVVMRDSTPRHTTFSIANTGEKEASAVTVKIKDSSILLDKSEPQIIIGTLDVGEFSTFSFPISPDANISDITLQIEYTDLAGIRAMAEKTVHVAITKEEINPTINETFYERYSNWMFGGLIGLLVGIFATIFIRRKD
jgi:hypothetical protein